MNLSLKAAAVIAGTITGISFITILGFYLTERRNYKIITSKQPYDTFLPITIDLINANSVDTTLFRSVKVSIEPEPVDTDIVFPNGKKANNFSINNNLFTIGILNPKVIDTNSGVLVNSFTFEISIDAKGFAPTYQTITISENRDHYIPVYLSSIGNPPGNGISIKDSFNSRNSFSLSDSVITKFPTESIALRAVDQLEIFLDSTNNLYGNGTEVPSNSTIAADVTFLTGRGSEISKIVPNGSLITKLVDEDGNQINSGTQFFKALSWLNIDLTTSNGEKIDSFSNEMSVTVDFDTLGTLPDNISVISLSEGKGDVWKKISNINKDGSKINFFTNHLSLFVIAEEIDTCEQTVDVEVSNLDAMRDVIDMCYFQLTGATPLCLGTSINNSTCLYFFGRPEGLNLEEYKLNTKTLGFEDAPRNVDLYVRPFYYNGNTIRNIALNNEGPPLITNCESPSETMRLSSDIDPQEEIDLDFHWGIVNETKSSICGASLQMRNNTGTGSSTMRVLGHLKNNGNVRIKRPTARGDDRTMRIQYSPTEFFEFEINTDWFIDPNTIPSSSRPLSYSNISGNFGAVKITHSINRYIIDFEITDSSNDNVRVENNILCETIEEVSLSLWQWLKIKFCEIISSDFSFCDNIPSYVFIEEG